MAAFHMGSRRLGGFPMHLREQLLRVGPAFGRALREGHLRVRLAGLHVESKPHHRIGREWRVLFPHALHVSGRDVAKAARRVGVRLHPRHERFVVAAGESAQVTHVERDRLGVVASAHGIGVEVDEVKLARKQFLSGAIVVVSFAPGVAARRVAEHLERRRHGMDALGERTRELRARLVVGVECDAVRLRAVDFGIAPGAGLDERAQ